MTSNPANDQPAPIISSTDDQRVEPISSADDQAGLTISGSWQQRVNAADWDEITGQLNDYGCALTPPLLTPDETDEIAALYGQHDRFRSTIDMGRHWFGSGGTGTPAAVPGTGRAAPPGALPAAAADRPGLVRQARPPGPVAGHAGRVAGHVPRRGPAQAHPDPAEIPAARLERAAPRPVWRPGVPAASGDQPEQAR